MIDTPEAEPVPAANPSGNHAVDDEAPGSFVVVSREKIYSWGVTYRLQLVRDVHAVEQRLGRDMLSKQPVVQRRSFAQPAGWETDVTLVGRELQPGDRVAVQDIANTARLWSAWV